MKFNPHQCSDAYFKAKRVDRLHCAFTLVEVLVVVAIVGILAAILFPVFSSARDAGRRSTCNSHLRQIGVALELYSNDYPHRFPTGIGMPSNCEWSEGLARYLKTGDILNCPSAPLDNYQPGCPPSQQINGITSTFDGAYNLNAGESGGGVAEFSRLRIRNPSQMISVIDGSGDLMSFGKGTGPIRIDQLVSMAVELRHKGGANAAFADGHVKWLSPTALQERSSWTLSGRDQS